MATLAQTLFSAAKMNSPAFGGAQTAFSLSPKKPLALGCAAMGGVDSFMSGYSVNCWEGFQLLRTCKEKTFLPLPVCSDAVRRFAAGHFQCPYGHTTN
ncbi:MAG: hypothetical protein SWC96_02685, partial [Thermodesulfobacteriota bacterium]|nr:hypothetical protein [Thermodesulfobacteriota bacterium]